MLNDVVLGDELVALKEETVEQVYLAVTGTMGPDGNYGVLANSTKPKTTKDGVSVARAIKYDNPTKDLIAQIITEAAVRTDADCGDGTTTTVFLTRQFYNQFKAQLGAKGSFIVKSQLNKLMKETITFLQEKVITADKNSELLAAMALTTANNDPVISGTVLDIFKSIPGVPDVDLRFGVDATDQVEYQKGLMFDGGYAHPSFSPGNNNSQALLESPRGVIFDGSFREIDPVRVEKMAIKFKELSVDGRPFVIVGKEFSREWIDLFLAIRSKLKINLVIVGLRAIGTAGSGLMGDLGVATTGSARDIFPSFDSWVDADVPFTEWEDIIVGGSHVSLPNGSVFKDEVKGRIKEIEDQIQQMTLDQRYSATANLMRRRINHLNGGQVTIYVGGETNSDIKERYDRYMDVARAVKSAITNGVLPGIGYTLALAGEHLREKYKGDSIAESFADVLGAQLEFLLGERYTPDMEYYNLATGEKGKTPMEIGVWDAYLATVTALKAGLTTAIILSSNHVVVLGSRGAAIS